MRISLESIKTAFKGSGHFRASEGGKFEKLFSTDVM